MHGMKIIIIALKSKLIGDQLNFVENSEEAQQVLSMINAKLTKIRGS